MSAFADLNPFANLAEQEKRNNGVAYVRSDNAGGGRRSMNAMASANNAGTLAFGSAFGTPQPTQASTANNEAFGTLGFIDRMLGTSKELDAMQDGDTR